MSTVEGGRVTGRPLGDALTCSVVLLDPHSSQILDLISFLVSDIQLMSVSPGREIRRLWLFLRVLPSFLPCSKFFQRMSLIVQIVKTH